MHYFFGYLRQWKQEVDTQHPELVSKYFLRPTRHGATLAFSCLLGKCKSKFQSLFSSVFGLLMEIFYTKVAKCSTGFTCKSLTCAWKVTLDLSTLFFFNENSYLLCLEMKLMTRSEVKQ